MSKGLRAFALHDQAQRYQPVYWSEDSHEVLEMQGTEYRPSHHALDSKTAEYESAVSDLPSDTASRHADNHEGQPMVGDKKHGWHGILFGGYRVGLIWCTGGVITVLLMNTIWIIWASATYGVEEGIGTLQDGKCEDTKKLSLWLHLVINVLGTILLAASNYTMQCLVSPTRAEVDKAHAKQKWLDIGVPSVRNLFHVSRMRCGLWGLVTISSIPLHLLYNSAVFSQLASVEYGVFVTTEEMATSPDINIDDFLSRSKNSDVNTTLSDFRSWERLENIDCMRAYGQSFVSSHGDLMLVTSSSNIIRGIDPLALGGSLIMGSTVAKHPGYGWMCAEYDQNQNTYAGICDLENIYPQAGSWNVSNPSESLSELDKTFVYQVDYCLSKPLEEHCSLQFSTAIMAVVIAANAVKAICMLLTLWRHREAPLVTLGDAIQSFLRSNDSTTVDNCLASKNEFRKKRWDYGVRTWEPLRRYWFHGASFTRWFLCNILCLTALGGAGGALTAALQETMEDRSRVGLWHMKFGAVNSNSMTVAVDQFHASRTYALFSTILIANSPQLLLSFLFLTYNSLYTCMLMAQEWHDYAKHRKALRVTDPTGKQRSTYRLQLPYKYGVPLTVLSGILHWLVSQSLFLVQVQGYTNGGAMNGSSQLSALGYSSIAIIATMILGGVAIIVGLGMGVRRYDCGMPLVGSCSAAISAACHQPKIDTDAAEKRLMWGVAENQSDGDGQVGHCSFTSLPVVPPLEGQLYAGKRRREG